MKSSEPKSKQKILQANRILSVVAIRVLSRHRGLRMLMSSVSGTKPEPDTTHSVEKPEQRCETR